MEELSTLLKVPSFDFPLGEMVYSFHCNSYLTPPLVKTGLYLKKQKINVLILNPLFCRKVKGDKGNVAAKRKPFKAPLVPRPLVPEPPMYSKFPLWGPWCNISRVDGKVIFRASIFILE